MNFNKAFSVARWEYFEKVKTKTFLVSLILTPLILIGMSIFPTMLASHQSESTKLIGVLDTSGVYFKQIKTELESYRIDDGQPNYVVINLYIFTKTFETLKKNADKDVVKSKIAGYILLKGENSKSVSAEYRTLNTGAIKDFSRIKESLTNTFTRLKLKSAGVPDSIISEIESSPKITQIKIEKNGEESKSDFLSLFFTSFIFVMLLMLMILSSGGMLVRSLVEEKSNRLIEILVSSCTADELLVGKVFGLGSLGLTQMFLWLLIGLVLAINQVIPIEVFQNIIPIMFYFILGFIFYTSIFVSVGSIVSTEQEAQQITSYLSIILVIPVALSVSAVESPNSLIVKILSYIPFTLPSIMMIRLNVTQISPIDFVTTILIMLLSIYITVSIASKLFKIGILSYGKRPSFKRLIEWIKE